LALAVLAAAAFFVAVAPVAAFFAVPRFEAVDVFFGAVVDLVDLAFFFVGVAGLVVVLVFAAGFTAGFAAGFFAFAAGFLAVVALVVDALVVLALVAVLALGVGLFSLADVSALTLGASFTFPLTPLGKTKVPFSAPVEMALAS